MSKNRQSRRQFLRRAGTLGTAGALAGCATTQNAATSAPQQPIELAAAPKPEPAARKTIDANSRIKMGAIGVGGRGSSVLQAAIRNADIDVVAICDTYDVWLDRAVGWARDEQPEARSYIHFEEMFEKEELDAVMIATPDHIHAPAILAALDHGAHVYTEKPMTLTWEEAKEVRNRVYETGLCLQVGTQLRSTDIYQQARDIIQSGKLGKLVEVRVNRSMWGGMQNYNSPPAEANASNVDWQAFLRDTKAYPFDTRRYFQWRQFEEYSNGVTGDLMVHHLDICNFVTGAPMPTRVMSYGNIAAYNDGRTVPDTISALIPYGDAFHFNYTTTLANGYYPLTERYMCSEGTLEVVGMNTLEIIHQKDYEQTVVTKSGLNTDAHMANFADAIRSGDAPLADIEAGFSAATLARMAVLSQRTMRTAVWNPETEMVEV